MVEARVLKPEAATDGTRVLVLMHGRGADPGDLAGLRSWLPDDLALVLPRAPFAAAPWGYGPGWAWYRYEGEDRPETESFRESQRELEAFLASIAKPLGFTPGPVVIGGFSQGGTMSLGYALRRPGAVAGVLNFSGFLPRHEDVPVTSDSAPGTPIFWGHGRQDPAIPFAMAVDGRARLRELGADLETFDHSMGHAILPDELEAAVKWLDRVAPAG